MRFTPTLRHFCQGTAIFILIYGFSLSLLQAQEATNKDKDRHIADEVAAMVGGVHILLSDIERVTIELEKLRSQEGTLVNRPARDEAFEMLLTQSLLSEQARTDSLDKDLGGNLDPQVENQLQQLVKDAGSVKNLERKHRKEIFAIKDELKKELENQQLANLMQSSVMQKVNITYSEVADFFATLPLDSMGMVPEQYVYAQIVRLPPATEERKFQVRQQLLEYRQRILDGDNLGALARLYSMDLASARSGGEWGPDDINKLVYPIVEILEDLKPGKVSEVIETEYGYHIVELFSLKGNLVHYRHILLKPEFTVEETEREMKLLDSIAKKIGTDKKIFEQAVLFFSMDEETRQNGGIVFNSRDAMMMYDTKYATSKFMKDALNPEDYRPLSTLKVGEVSNAYSTIDSKGNTVYKIVRLNEIIPTHYANMHQDYEVIADFALSDKQNREIDRWINETIRSMYIWVSPEYRDAQFERNWLKK